MWRIRARRPCTLSPFVFRFAVQRVVRKNHFSFAAAAENANREFDRKMSGSWQEWTSWAGSSAGWYGEPSVWRASRNVEGEEENVWEVYHQI